MYLHALRYRCAGVRDTRSGSSQSATIQASLNVIPSGSIKVFTNRIGLWLVTSKAHPVGSRGHLDLDDERIHQRDSSINWARMWLFLKRTIGFE